MRLSVFIFYLLLSTGLIYAKRGGSGRSRSRSSSSGWSLFTRKSKSTSDAKPIPQKTVENVQTVPQRKANVPTTRPIGWNVNNKPASAAPPYSARTPPRVTPPPYSAHNPHNVAPPPYSAHNPHLAPPPYGTPHQYHSNSYLPPPPYSGGSSWFGGRKSYGGYGLGNYGYPYGMKKSGGFFGKHAFRNILGGLFVWYLVSGLVKTPYRVYNYYNKPEIQEDLTLPANVLMLCNENATNVCVPGNTAICTQDNRVLCVASMSSTNPCPDNQNQLCVNSTIPCIDQQDPLCANRTDSSNATTVNFPCFTNLNVQNNGSQNVDLPPSNNHQYCVTSMAVPDPSIPPPEQLEASLQNNTSNWNGTIPVAVEGQKLPDLNVTTANQLDINPEHTTVTPNAMTSENFMNTSIMS